MQDELAKGDFTMQNDKIQGINCDVASCVYNRDNCECMAGKVDICCCCDKPDCCDETICRTFKPKG